MLGTELRSCERAANTLNFRAYSPTPNMLYSYYTHIWIQNSTPKPDVLLLHLILNSLYSFFMCLTFQLFLKHFKPPPNPMNSSAPVLPSGIYFVLCCCFCIWLCFSRLPSLKLFPLILLTHSIQKAVYQKMSDFERA